MTNKYTKLGETTIIINNNLSVVPIPIPQPIENTHGTIATGFNTSFSQFTSEFTKDVKQSGGPTLSYPLDTPKYIFTMTILDYHRDTLNTIGTLKPAAGYPGIVMPLPMQLTDANKVNWQEIEVTNIGSIGRGVLGGISGALGSAFGGPIGAGIGGIIGNSIGQGIETVGGALVGISPNQFVTLLMRGPTYKRHHFRWELSPTNYDEADVLRKIVTMWKNAMAPSFAWGGFVFDFPKIFHIRLYPNSGFMYKFKPCVCDNFVANYTSGGRAAFYYNKKGIDGGNPPEGITIEATFIELEYWTEKDYGSYDLDNDPDHVSARTTTTSTSATNNNELNQLLPDGGGFGITP